MTAARKFTLIPLYTHYPMLAEKLPHVSLATLPTPVARLDPLGHALGVRELYAKRDDLTGEAYGGNKVRKLEFLLAHAGAEGMREVMTFGTAGSNHALATAVYARQLGLRSISMLCAQVNARYVGKNLLLSHRAGAELHHYEDEEALVADKPGQRDRHRALTGMAPQTIRGGGSSPLGTLGFVNAAFELRDQVAAGILPEPDFLYLALGTAGTAVGLMLGLEAAGLKTQVVPVRVVHESIGNAERIATLFRQTNALLREADPSFGVYEPTAQDLAIRQEFYGERYALFTDDGMRAMRRARDAGLMLEGTYTGKAFACMLADLKQPRMRDKVVLFWNTYSSVDFSETIATIDYRELPPAFHRYFEEPPQPLDRDDD